MANLNNYIITFIKISVITTLFFGGLLAQSYATNLVSDSIMNTELTTKDIEDTNQKTASVLAHEEEPLSFSFGNYQLNIKSIAIQDLGLSLQDLIHLHDIKMDVTIVKKNG